jgi:hypothetical protein
LNENESETEEIDPPEFVDDEVQKDTEDVENSLKKCCTSDLIFRNLYNINLNLKNLG